MLRARFAGAGFTDVAFEVVTLHTAVDDVTALEEYFAACERGEVHVESLLAVFIGSAAA